MRLDLTEARVQVSGGGGTGAGTGASLGGAPGGVGVPGPPRLRSPGPAGETPDPAFASREVPTGLRVFASPARPRAGSLAAIKSPVGLRNSPLSARTNRAI